MVPDPVPAQEWEILQPHEMGYSKKEMLQTQTTLNKFKTVSVTDTDDLMSPEPKAQPGVRAIATKVKLVPQ